MNEGLEGLEKKTEEYTEARVATEALEKEERGEKRISAGRGSLSRKRRRRRRKRRLTGFAKGLIVLVIALLLGLCSFFVMNRLMKPAKEETTLSGESVSVTIPEGAGTDAIAKILKENGLIRSVFGFKLTSKLAGFDGTYKQGTYSIDTALTKRQIMELLQSGKIANDIRLTIPEGYTVKQIAERVEETGLCTAEEFLEECNNGSFDYDFLADLPERKYRLEGYLFPDTYFLNEGTTVHDIVDVMLQGFQRMYTEEYQRTAEKSGYSLDEIVTIASMIEKEIKVAEERPTAAGVIYNRLQAGMTLGIDATVLYAVEKTSGELTATDLETDSPYNTRIRRGLPLGPIASPGASSFQAALYPEDNDYLYYVVEAAGKDNHVFCKTYEEFLAAKSAYQAGNR